MNIDTSNLAPKSQSIVAAGKFYFITGSGTATATTTATTTLGAITGMGCLP
jgi:hydroxyethylthiazole kinase-like sugar kinase family protein